MGQLCKNFVAVPKPLAAVEVSRSQQCFGGTKRSPSVIFGATQA